MSKIEFAGGFTYPQYATPQISRPISPIISAQASPCTRSPRVSRPISRDSSLAEKV